MGHGLSISLQEQEKCDFVTLELSVCFSAICSMQLYIVLWGCLPPLTEFMITLVSFMKGLELMVWNSGFV